MHHEMVMFHIITVLNPTIHLPLSGVLIRWQLAAGTHRTYTPTDIRARLLAGVVCPPSSAFPSILVERCGILHGFVTLTTYNHSTGTEPAVLHVVTQKHHGSD